MIKAVFLLCLLSLMNASPSWAGVFNIPEFVDYQSWAFGLEPEITFDTFEKGGGGFGSNAKFTYGLTPLSNLQIGIGTGAGSKGFRVGGTYSFDFIPDMEGQVGLGVAAQGYYIKLHDASARTEGLIYPYVHKSFGIRNGMILDPYVAVPFGMAFHAGTYRTVVQGVIGTAIRTNEHVRLHLESGFNIKDYDSTLSFGLSYRN